MRKWIRSYLNLRFNQKLLLSFILLLLPATLFVSISSYIMTNILITRYASDYSTAISSQIAANFSTRIDSIEEANFNKYQNDRAFSEYLPPEDTTSPQYRLLYQSAIDHLLYSTSYYESICFIDKDDQIYQSGPDTGLFQNREHVIAQARIARKGWGKCTWTRTGNGNLLLKRALYHLHTGAYIGSVLIEVNSSSLTCVYEQSISSYGGSVVVLDSDQVPVISETDLFNQIALDAWKLSSQKTSPLIKKGGETYVTSICSTPDNRWTMIHITPLSRLTDNLHAISYGILITGLIVLALAVAIAYLISGNITQNLKLLLVSMDHLAKGNFDQPITPVSRDEFGIIADHFNVMADKI